jgi:wyosine [tRNA(Phe)-imidazoG37] synthetase (radical SAM superfamily)
VPFKTCSYDCIYCQLGRTTQRTCERREWVPLEPVLAELKRKLDTKPDYITLSGSGEPTLHSRTGELIAAIKALTDTPVAVLTNGSLLWQPELRRELQAADLVIPSLDAGDEETFQAINRPDPSLNFAQMLTGLIDLRLEFKGQYWLEVFLLAGHNTNEPALANLIEAAQRIKPDRIQLNTAVRPPAEDHARAVSAAEMEQIALRFDPPAEVTADFRAVHELPEFAVGRQEILTLLQRRPCTVADIAGALGIHQNEVIKYVEELKAEGAIEGSERGDRRYYQAAHRKP